MKFNWTFIVALCCTLFACSANQKKPITGDPSTNTAPLSFDQFINDAPGSEITLQKEKGGAYRAKKENFRPFFINPIDLDIHYKGFRENFVNWCRNNDGTIFGATSSSAGCRSKKDGTIIGHYEFEVTKTSSTFEGSMTSGHVIYRYRRQNEISPIIKAEKDKEWQNYLEKSKKDAVIIKNTVNAGIGTLMCNSQPAYFPTYKQNGTALVKGFIEKMDTSKLQIRVNALSIKGASSLTLEDFTDSHGIKYSPGALVWVERGEWLACQ